MGVDQLPLIHYPSSSSSPSPSLFLFLPLSLQQDVEKRVSSCYGRVQAVQRAYTHSHEQMCFAKVELKQERVIDTLSDPSKRSLSPYPPSLSHPQTSQSTSASIAEMSKGVRSKLSRVRQSVRREGTDGPLVSVRGGMGAGAGVGGGAVSSGSTSVTHPKSSEEGEGVVSGESGGERERESDGVRGEGGGRVRADGYGPRVSDDGSEVRGYLWKHGKNLVTPWRRKYFVIQGGYFFAQKGRSDARDESRSLNLQLCTAKIAGEAETDRRFCFHLISPQKAFLLQAESDRDLSVWLQTIQSATLKALDVSHSSHPSSSSSAPSTSFPSPSPSPSHSSPSSFSPLERLRAASQANERCAECGSHGPQWASLNLGVLICIECSGIHRSLGTHRSKVRSLTLDAIDAEGVVLLLRIGNERANRIFEACLPRDSECKPTESSGRQVRESFIFEKYVSRRWVRPIGHEGLPPPSSSPPPPLSPSSSPSPPSSYLHLPPPLTADVVSLAPHTSTLAVVDDKEKAVAKLHCAVKVLVCVCRRERERERKRERERERERSGNRCRENLNESKDKAVCPYQASHP